MEPAAPDSSRRLRELSIGVGSAAGILALIVAPWWVLDIGLIGLGAAALWWARTVPLERVLTSRTRMRLLPVAILAGSAVVAYGANGVVDRISLLTMSVLTAAASVVLVIRWHGFARN